MRLLKMAGLNCQRLLLCFCVSFTVFWASIATGNDTNAQLDLLSRYGIKHDTASLTNYLRGLMPSSERQREVAQLVQDLGDDRWAVRESATKRLVLIGDEAREALEQALSSSDAEVRFRAAAALENPDFTAKSGIRRTLTLAVLEVLKVRNDPAAVTTLLVSLPMTENDLTVYGYICEALWSSVDASHLALLAEALDSENILQQSAAIVALEVSASKSGQAEIQTAVDAIKPFLADDSPRVRLAAARALIDREARACVQALLKLVGESEWDIGWQADALLLLKTGERMDLSEGLSLQEAWSNWSRDNLAKADLSRQIGADRLDLTTGRGWLKESFAIEAVSLDGGYDRFVYESTNTSGAEVRDGKLRHKGTGKEGDQRLSIRSDQMIGRDRWPDEIEVIASLGGQEGNSGGWHIGVSVGNVKVLFHPGYSKGSFRAEDRISYAPIIPNEDMNFFMAADVLYEMTLRIKKTDNGAEFNVSIKDAKGDATFKKTFTATQEQLGDYNQIGLERSGKTGGDAIFDSISIRLMP